MVRRGAFDSLWDDYVGLQGVLAHDPSGMIALQRTFPKVLLLASASFLEAETTRVVREMVVARSVDVLGHFVYNRSLNRQFHSLFDWDGDSKGANKFFSLFGEDCKAHVKAQLTSDESIKAAVLAFITVGKRRNELVHNNFAEYDFPLTAAEVRELHDEAVSFPELITELVFPQGD